MIGIHVSLWTPEWTAPFIDHIYRAGELGFDCVEVPVMDPARFPVDAVKTALHDTGLAVFCGTGLGPGTDISRTDADVQAAGQHHLEQCLTVCAAIGSPSLGGVIHSAWGLRERASEAHREASATVLKRIARSAGELGIRLSLECINRYESSFLNTVAQGLGMLERIGESNVGLHLDTYHMNIEERSISEAMQTAGSCLTHLHLSDNHRGYPGSGSLPFAAIIESAREAGYTGPWVIESYVDPTFATSPDVCIWREIEPEADSLARSLAEVRELTG